MRTITTHSSNPMWIPGFVDQYILEDEISLLQYGQNEELTFERLRVETAEHSYYTEFPTEDEPQRFYKFSSLWL